MRSSIGWPADERAGIALGQPGDDAHALGQLDHADAEGDLALVAGGGAVTAVQAHSVPRRGQLDRLGVLGGAVGAGVGPGEVDRSAGAAAAAQQRGRVAVGEESLADHDAHGAAQLPSSTISSASNSQKARSEAILPAPLVR